MVFKERKFLISPEREALLSSRDPYYKIRTHCLSTANYVSVALAFVAGFIALLLLIAIFQCMRHFEEQPPPQNVSSSSPSSPTIHRMPLLKSIQESKNWKKISTQKYQTTKKTSNSNNNNSPHISDFLRSYPQPTFRMVGNRTVASYHLIITKGHLSPDGFPQPAYLINGQSPGPEIRVQQNSILIVTVENHLDTGITFHFHGIHQRKTFLSDGVPQVTQTPISPGESFIYTMDLSPQVGTHFYHAHTNLDIVWLYGPLIIEDNPEKYKTYPDDYQYNEDRIFILNGVYHEDLNSLVKKITEPHQNINSLGPVLMKSITVNGRSFVEWSNTISEADLCKSSEHNYDITSVTPGLRYRFRFINAASDSVLSCRISSHILTIIEMDGIYTSPIETDRIVISPGQRYSAIIKMEQSEAEANYVIMCHHLELRGPLNGLAVLKYFNATKPTEQMLQEFYYYGVNNDTNRLDRWIIDDLTPNEALKQRDVYPVPQSVHKEFILDAVEEIKNGRKVYLVNGHYFKEPRIPYFQQLQRKINISDNPLLFELLEGESVQFVFQNTRIGQFCFSHPWHIHGHAFHVVGEGPNRYHPTVDGAKIQRDIESGKKFMLRDAVTVYANQTVGEWTHGSFCGWTAVRFVANNNGLWLGHCHVTSHLLMGKKFVIWEHSRNDPMLIELMSTKFDLVSNKY